MEASVLLNVKQMAFLWLVGGNLSLMVWALALYWMGRNSAGWLYYRVVVLFQWLVLLAVVVGAVLLLAGHRTTPGHFLYAFLNGALALARLAWHGRIMQAGRKGLLWLALWAALAAALAARSAVTAR